MTVKQLVSVVVITVWAFTQSAMLHAHAGNDSHAGHMSSEALSTDHSVHAAQSSSHAEQHDDCDMQSDPSHSDMAGMDCCGSICTVDAQTLACSLGSTDIGHLFTSAKAVTLTSAEPGLPTPPPNTTS